MEALGAPPPTPTPPSANALEMGGENISGHFVFHKTLCLWITVVFREMSQVLVIWERSDCARGSNLNSKQSLFIIQELIH